MLDLRVPNPGNFDFRSGLAEFHKFRIMLEKCQTVRRPLAEGLKMANFRD